MKISEVVRALEHFAPLPLQADFDNAGLQVGLTEAQVSGALLCLDVTEQIVEEAVALGCNLIVSHHPLIFRKLARIAGENDVQRTVMSAIQHGVTIVSMHTNMDAARGGVNYKIAEKLGLEQVAFLGRTQQAAAPLLEAEHQQQTVDGADGVIGQLAEPMAADDFMLMLKRTFNVEMVQANQLLRRPIQRVALCGGAGSFLLDDAIRAGADAFITGEMSYHNYFGHEQEIQIAVIGHYESEQFTNEIFRDIIERECPEVDCYLTKTNTNPVIYL